MLYPNLLILRKRQNLTQLDVARVLGIHRSAYNKLEKGHRDLYGAELTKLGRLYNIPEVRLLAEVPMDDPIAMLATVTDGSTTELLRGIKKSLDEIVDALRSMGRRNG